MPPLPAVEPPRAPRRRRRRAALIAGALLALVALVCLYSLRDAADRLRDQVTAECETRHELASQHVDRALDSVVQMRTAMQERLAAPTGSAEGPPPTRTLQRHPHGTGWTLQSAAPLVGVATGMGHLPAQGMPRRELAAALSLDSLMGPALARNSDLAWLYYTSASGFIYLAPAADAAGFELTRDQYLREFWQAAIPGHNPSRALVITGLYDDGAGKGLMVSASAPLFDGDTFLGVVSADLSLKTLRRIVQQHHTLGETLIVGKGGRLIANDGSAPPTANLDLPPQPLQWHRGSDGIDAIAAPLVDDELWMVQRVSRFQLYRQAVIELAPLWALALLLVTVGVLVWRLVRTLGKVTRTTQTDPLTNALNRRGLYERARISLAMVGRRNQRMAVMILDIDHFKHINDRYGHAAGDEVLREMSAQLRNTCRPFDLVCRWGGEEFVVIVSLDDAEQAEAIATRIWEHAAPRQTRHCKEPITVSAGLVLLLDNEDLDAAIGRADRLLYQAKQAGRNRLICDLSGDPGWPVPRRA